MEDARPPASEWTIPPALAALPNWVLWRSIPDENGREQKVLWQAKANRPAKSNTPSTWATLADVLAKADKFGNRIGFVFRREDRLTGIDLDGAVCDGAIAQWAIEILHKFDGVAYCEFSPSGTGIHLITRGNLPAGGKNKKLPYEKTTAKEPGLEVYDHGRYFTFTGDTIGGTIGDGQAAIDWLWATHWPAKTTAQPVRSPVQLDERITRYMQRVDVSVSGQRGHDRALWAARCLITGFNLPPDEALEYLSEWNAGCLPPWSEKELLHKINQAATTPSDKPAGWLLTELQTDWPVVPAGFLANLGKGAPAPNVVVDPPAKPKKPVLTAFPADCLRPPGLIGDIVDHTLATAYDPQPELALSGAIAMMSLLVGGKVVDKRKTRPNVYVVGVEKTSAGKDAARMTNKAILTALGREELTEDNIGSDSGLTRYITDVPNCLLQIDEIHHMLVSMRNTLNQPHMVAVGRELLTLFPASGTFYKTKLLASAKRTTIRNPNVVLYGTCTVNGFWENITRELIEGGLLGRCMVFEGRGYVASQEPSDQELSESILTRARGWLELKTTTGSMAGQLGHLHPPRLVEHTKEAWDRTGKHRDEINRKVLDGEDDFRAAIWKRTAERTNKLALLFACSRAGHEFAPTITIEDANLAIKISNWLTNKMLQQVGKYVADSDFERDCLKLASLIESRGCLTGTQLFKSPSPLKKLRPRERKDVMEAVLESGEMFAEAQKSAGGRPTILYYSPDRWSQRLAELSNTNDSGQSET